MKKPWSVPYLFLSSIVVRAGLVAAVFAGLFLFPAQAHAARTITSATLNAVSSVTVAPGATITAVVNVTTTGTGTAARWRSTGWRIAAAPGAVTCVNHPNHDSAGAYSETFSITAPATSGTYNAYFIAYNNDSCSSGASATRTMTGAVTVTNPVPTVTSISPASKNVGDGAFTLTVNGTNFMSGSVVRFNGLDRTTTYVSATQLTAAIPASDLTAAGTFPITVFNPAPGGTSSAQTFTVTTAFPAATTMAASGITTPNNGTHWSATLNGIVSSNSMDTTVTFEYGLTTAYGTSITATQSPLAAGAVNAAVSADLIGLNCNTTYHYQVKATNSAGTSYGLDSTFTTGSCPLAPFAASDCAATRFGSNLVCTANDVNLTGITVAPGSVSSCVSGMPVTLDIDMTVNFATPDRWDVGIFIANDGKLPTQLPANGGASSCSVDILPITPETGSYTFPDLDGVPQGNTGDTCGDGNSAINGGTGSGVKRMTGVTLPCYATPASGGKLFVPFVVSWDNQKSPIGGLCTSNQYPVPNTTSKCNAPLSSVAIEVVVLPKIIKTHSGATFNPPTAPIIYTITVFNDSGGTLQQSTLTDPAVTGLEVSTVTCATANGSICPTTSKALMQGSGIVIPSANLPNNSSLIFTVTGTLSGSIGQTISNTASISIGPNTNSSTDSVTLGSASASKSFAPAAITEDNNSLMTITFTNPTAFDVTDVSFIDTYPSGLVNAVSPNVSTTCGGTVTAIAGGLTFSGGIIPASGSCTVSVYVTSATANNYINSVSFLPGSLGSASATLTVNVAVFGAFNACDVGTSCTNTTTPTISRITTKIAGSPFTLDIVALKTDGSRNTNYRNDVLVELLDASDNSGALDAYNCRSSWTAVIATLSPNPVFANPDNGLKTVGLFTVANAYRDVRVRVTNAGGATKKGCSTDNFAIRPSAVTMFTNASAAAPSASVTPIFSAGAAFTLYATTTAGTNYNGTLTLDIGKLTAQVTSQDTAQEDGGTVGTLSPTTLTANPTPSLPSDNASYSEVGYLYLNAGAFRDDTYTSADAAGDCNSNTSLTNPPVPDYLSDVPVNGKYGCSVGNKTTVSLGRFIPDHFGLTGTVVTRSDLQTIELQATPFTYMDEPMKLSLVVTAYNKNEAPTQNYAGSFAKLDATTLGSANLANWTCTSGAQCMGLAAVSGATTLTSRLVIDTTSTNSAVPSNTTTLGGATPGWSGGTSYFTLYSKFVRLAAPDGPYDTIGTNILKIGAKPLDSDGVTVPLRSSIDTTHCVELDVTTGTESAACDPGTTEANLRRKLFETKARYGRMKVANAYGSELLPLTMTATVQYCNAVSGASCSDWRTSVDDSLTSISLGTLVYDHKTGTGWTTTPTPMLMPGEDSPATWTVRSGVRKFSLSAPGAGNTGNVTVPTNAVGTYLPSASARATFGVYKGNNQFIYLREMY